MEIINKSTVRYQEEIMETTQNGKYRIEAKGGNRYAIFVLQDNAYIYRRTIRSNRNSLDYIVARYEAIIEEEAEYNYDTEDLLYHNDF